MNKSSEYHRRTVWNISFSFNFRYHDAHSPSPYFSIFTRFQMSPKIPFCVDVMFTISFIYTRVTWYEFKHSPAWSIHKKHVFVLISRFFSRTFRENQFFFTIFSIFCGGKYIFSSYIRKIVEMFKSLISSVVGGTFKSLQSLPVVKPSFSILSMFFIIRFGFYFHFYNLLNFLF